MATPLNSMSPFDRCMYPHIIRPIPRSPSMPTLPSVNEEEIDLAEVIEKKYEEDRMRKAAEAQERFIVESRMKIFRHVYGLKLKSEKR